jgi:hypothetical protein
MFHDVALLVTVSAILSRVSSDRSPRHDEPVTRVLTSCSGRPGRPNGLAPRRDQAPEHEPERKWKTCSLKTKGAKGKRARVVLSPSFRIVPDLQSSLAVLSFQWIVHILAPWANPQAKIRIHEHRTKGTKHIQI